MAKRSDERAARPRVWASLLRLGAAAALGSLASGPLRPADERARSMCGSCRSERLDRALPVLTDLGSMYAVAGLAATLWALGRRRLARDALGAGALAWAVAQGSKRVFARPRPYEAGEVDVLIDRPMGASYPSGHPAVAEAVCRVLAPSVRPAMRPMLGRLPKLVGGSRVYVGAHYPTDVAGGILVGRAVGDLWRRFARA
ncbi:MAG: phosphatase PAP2 family protein [Acidobacteria bacterium]|nr:phosphatase PAP2 family protein [Acidobacteriota bacterium]